MTDVPPLDSPEDGASPDMAAAELALGLLDGDDRAVAIRRVLAEPGFARDVERWRGHLAQLFDLWPAMEAPDVFARVERSIDLPPGPVAALTPLPAARPSKLWPGLAALSSIAAAGLLVVLVTRPVPVPPVPVPPAPPPRAAAPVVPATPLLVASIASAEKGAPVTAVYDDRSGELRLTEAKLADAGRSAELWIIPAGDAPHSLGLLRSRGGTALTVRPADRARIAAGAVLAVSLEPIGGSPTGLPTGPVVATGALSRV